MNVLVMLQSLSITAALLPSLQAQYKMDQVNSTGVTGSKAKFTVDLPQHSLSFTTKLQVHNVSDVQVVCQDNKVLNIKSTWSKYVSICIYIWELVYLISGHQCCYTLEYSLLARHMACMTSGLSGACHVMHIANILQICFCLSAQFLLTF